MKRKTHTIPYKIVSTGKFRVLTRDQEVTSRIEYGGNKAKREGGVGSRRCAQLNLAREGAGGEASRVQGERRDATADRSHYDVVRQGRGQGGARGGRPAHLARLGGP